MLEHQFARNDVRTSARAGAASSIRNTVERDGRRRRDSRCRASTHALIAVGTRPLPAAPTCRFDGDPHLRQRRDPRARPACPRTLTVVGASVIGVEYATIFSALDVPVTLIEPRNDHPRLHRPRDHRRVRPRPARPRHEHPLRRAVKEIVAEAAELGRGRRSTDGRTMRSRHGALRRRPRRRRRPAWASTPAASTPTTAAASRSTRRPSRPTCRTSMPPATSSASRASPRPRWSRAASPPATPSACRCRRRRSSSPMASMRCRRSRPSAMTEEEVREKRHPLRVRRRPLPRDLARPHHGPRLRLHEDDLRARDAPAAGRPHRRRGRHRADPHRPGGAQPRAARVDYFVENTFNYPTLAEAYKIAGLDAWNRMGQ